MKKMLLASTALVAFAGAAAAEVALSGYAEIGVKDDGSEVQFHNDIDVKFSLSGTTDNGLSFGATIDLDEVNASAEVGGNGGPGADGIFGTADDGKSWNRSSVWVSGDFGKVTLGDTDGAFDWALSEIYMGTAIADDHSTHAGAYWFTGLDGSYDGQVMRYEYAMDAVAFAISAELDDSGVGDAVLGLGVKWSGDMGGSSVSVGLGYQDNGTADVVGLSAGVSMANGLALNLGYADGSLMGGADDTWWGVGLGYTAGAMTVQANYGEYDSGADGFGLVVNYDLGGGAVAMLGYGDSGSGSSTWSAGLGLSF